MAGPASAGRNLRMMVAAAKWSRTGNGKGDSPRAAYDGADARDLGLEAPSPRAVLVSRELTGELGGHKGASCRSSAVVSASTQVLARLDCADERRSPLGSGCASGPSQHSSPRPYEALSWESPPSGRPRGLSIREWQTWREAKRAAVRHVHQSTSSRARSGRHPRARLDFVPCTAAARETTSTYA